MKKSIIEDFCRLADRYEIKDFIQTDPIQFPHRYSIKQDIEISGFVAAWLAYGSRQVFIPVLDELHRLMGESPYQFILSGEYRGWAENKATLYRFCKWNDLYEVCFLLSSIYSDYVSMEDWVKASGEAPLHCLQKKFGHLPQLPLFRSTSACKKLHMFLRWMIRRNSPVDFGIWKQFEPSILLVPVDTHVLQQARIFEITNRKQADHKTTEEITAFARKVFPDDPARMDFVLYQPPYINKEE